MNVSELDSLEESAVPLWCLLYADWLSERGVPDGGWRALGSLGKVPEPNNETSVMWWVRFGVLESRLPRKWFDRVFPMHPTRSSAMLAAADAFLQLSPETQRAILETAQETVT